jgi:hypothetical protein
MAACEDTSKRTTADDRLSLEIYRKSNDIKVPSFILSGAPFFHHSRTKLGTPPDGMSASGGKRAYEGRLGKDRSASQSRRSIAS